MEFVRKLPIPKEIREMYPLSEASREKRRNLTQRLLVYFRVNQIKRYSLSAPARRIARML